jgi:drug/metabolite transporter (DMT)-like permease
MLHPPPAQNQQKSERGVQHPEAGKQASQPDAVGLDTASRARRSRDTVVTVMLLGLGLAWILISIPGTSDLAGTLDRTYALQGYTGHYGPVALASALGLAINISSLVLWGITCAVSIAVLRRHRRAFYIPLIGAVLSGLVVIALTLVAMFNDPGLLAYLDTLQK